jgi:hypothetical protein
MLSLRVGMLAGLLQACVCLCSSALLAQPADAPEPALKAKLILKTNKYNLDPAQAGPEFVKKLKESEKDMTNMPPFPPAVEMSLELTNVGKDPVTIPLGGDATHLDLKLEGPGAVTVPYVKMHTMEYRFGNPTPIEPGKSLSIPIARLTFGSRGDSFACYWTALGGYTLTASYTTPLNPLPGGKFKSVTFAAAPEKVNVVPPGVAFETNGPTVTQTFAVAAAALLKEKGLACGQPKTVQQLLSGGWSLQYPTPDQEVRILGLRTVTVSPEGTASIMFRE